MKNVFLKYIAIIGFVAILAGCASGVKQTAGVEATKLSSAKVTQVQITLTDEAKKLVSDNANFSVTGLKAAIEDQLKALDLIKPDAGQVMEVTLKSFRARSAFSAIAFGFMAGNDNIVGVMTIKDAAGKTLKSTEINASYALGGIAGGMTETRMGWLYGEFAKLAIQELNGTSTK
jgi:uncharacterized protein YceK